MPNTPNFDRAALVWNLPWDPSWVTAVSYIGATRRIAAGNRLGQILLWDLPERPGGDPPMPVRQLDGHTNQITKLLSSPDGRWLISSSYDHTIRYWDMQAPSTGNVTVELNAEARAEARRRRRRDIPDLITATVERQNSARTLEGHGDWIQALCVSTDGSMLFSGDDTGRVIVWDRETGREQRRWQLTGWAHAIAVSPNRQQLAISERIRLVFSSDRHWAVKLWNPSNGQMERDLSELFRRQEIGAAAFSPDGRLLALGQGGEVSGTAKIYIIDPSNGRKLREFATHRYGVTDMAFTPDGNFLLSSGRDTTVRVWNPANGQSVKQIGSPRGGQFKDWIHAFSLSRDQRWLTAADMAGQVQVWHLPT